MFFRFLLVERKCAPVAHSETRWMEADKSSAAGAPVPAAPKTPASRRPPEPQAAAPRAHKSESPRRPPEERAKSPQGRPRRSEAEVARSSSACPTAFFFRPTLVGSRVFWNRRRSGFALALLWQAVSEYAPPVAVRSFARSASLTTCRAASRSSACFFSYARSRRRSRHSRHSLPIRSNTSAIGVNQCRMLSKVNAENR